MRKRAMGAIYALKTNTYSPITVEYVFAGAGGATLSFRSCPPAGWTATSRVVSPPIRGVRRRRRLPPCLGVSSCFYIFTIILRAALIPLLLAVISHATTFLLLYYLIWLLFSAFFIVFFSFTFGGKTGSMGKYGVEHGLICFLLLYQRMKSMIFMEALSPRSVGGRTENSSLSGLNRFAGRIGAVCLVWGWVADKCGVYDIVQ